MTEYIEREVAIAHPIIVKIGPWEGPVVPVETVNAVPAADVRPVMRGRWIPHYESTSDNEMLEYGWECSICGRWEMDKEPFCNCGAKMEES